MTEPITTPAGNDQGRALALVDDAIVRVPKIGGAGAIYEAELLAVLRSARSALATHKATATTEAVMALRPNHAATCRCGACTMHLKVRAALGIEVRP